MDDYLTPTGEILADILLQNPLLLQDLIFNQPPGHGAVFSKRSIPIIRTT